MIVEALLLICMATPVGGEYCTPAIPKLLKPNLEACELFIQEEIKYLETESSLEEFRSHLPAMKEGKLLLKWSCARPIQRKWLDREIPKMQIGA